MLSLNSAVTDYIATDLEHKLKLDNCITEPNQFYNSNEYRVVCIDYGNHLINSSTLHIVEAEF